MHVEIEEIGDVIVASPAGALDGRTAGEFEGVLLSLVRPDMKVVLDMRHVRYLSSAGLRSLLVLYRTITNEHGRIVLSNLPDRVADTMLNTGFLDFFESYPGREEALAALA